MPGEYDSQMGANSSNDNFTCGKWNLTSEEHDFQKLHGYWVQSRISLIIYKSRVHFLIFSESLQ